MEYGYFCEHAHVQVEIECPTCGGVGKTAHPLEAIRRDLNRFSEDDLSSLLTEDARADFKKGKRLEGPSCVDCEGAGTLTMQVSLEQLFRRHTRSKGTE